MVSEIWTSKNIRSPPMSMSKTIFGALTILMALPLCYSHEVLIFPSYFFFFKGVFVNLDFGEERKGKGFKEHIFRI